MTTKKYNKEQLIKAIEYGARLVDVSFWDEAGDGWKKKQVDKFMRSIEKSNQSNKK